jgi:hypothetical protein
MLTSMKFSELLFLISITITVVTKVSLLITMDKEIPESAPTPSVMLLPIMILNTVIMFFHTMHSNLFSNTRLFWSKKYGWVCCWEPVNWLICKFGRPYDAACCRDRCVTVTTLIKYIIVIPLFVWPATELLNMCDQFKE